MIDTTNFGEPIFFGGTEIFAGTTYPRYYYVSGIKEFDEILGANKFAELNLILMGEVYKSGILLMLTSARLEYLADKFFPIETLISYEILDKVIIDKPIFKKAGAQLVDLFTVGAGTGAIGIIAAGASRAARDAINNELYKKHKIKKTGSKKITGTKAILKHLENGVENEIVITFPYWMDTQIFRDFWKPTYLKEIEERKNTKGACFIATVCYNDAHAYEVCTLRDFRDGFLYKTVFGRKVIKNYYRYGESIAKKIKNKKYAIAIIKHLILKPIVLITELFRINRPKQGRMKE